MCVCVCAIGIAVDFTKAFDTVMHEILAKTIYLIHDGVHKWIMISLTNINCLRCKTNCVCNIVNIFKFILFTDNTNMIYCNGDLVELVEMTNIELKKGIRMVCSKQALSFAFFFAFSLSFAFFLCFCLWFFLSLSLFRFLSLSPSLSIYQRQIINYYLVMVS